ncbi:PHYLLO [Symbiodinium sp. CCMP2592]|nr:PHYLLO [Symbiodinium sp. CCMP2592]
MLLDQLEDVRRFTHELGAFAAILVDGTVVAWGDEEFGGDCREVQAQLTNVQHLQSNGHAYAAIRRDGSVVTWGDPDFGGDSSYVQDSLKDIRQIQATCGNRSGGFAAIRADGCGVIWGGRFYSGRPELEEGAPGDYEIQATMGDFCAQRPDGVLVTWGGFRYGGTSCGVQAQLQDVRQIQVTLAGLFAAVLADGSIVKVLIPWVLGKCGYSLGGRVAMAFAESYPKKCIGLVALSANPGLQSPGEQRQRWLQDQKQAKQLLNSNFEEFLDRWYAAPLWGGLKERQPEVYSRMLAKRRTVRPQMAALSLLGSSLSRQPPCWSPPCPLWYAYGELDAKFAAIGREIAEKSSSAGSQVHVRALTKIGHAVVEEAPFEVAKFIAEAADSFGSSSSSRPREESTLRLESAWSEPIQVMLKAPLLLARGEPLHHREGILLVLQGRSGADGPLAAGLGEVTPLPQFHKETLGEAQAQLGTVLSNLAAATPEVPAELARLDGSLGRWLEKYSPGPLLPSVRAGLEMALLHLLRRDYPQPYAAAALARGLCCQSEVSINSLVAQNDDLDTDGASVAKLKVGKDPKQDAARTNRLAEKLHERRGDKARLRLDANRAWTTAQAAEFLNSLSPAAVALTDYLEEPTQWEPGQSAAEFLQQWEDVSTATGSRVRLAVDESLTEGVVSLEDLTKCKAPIAALVLKPSLQGIEQTVAMSMWALERGAMPVLSSAFESGVALVHFALLGAALVQQPWKGDAGKVHGLGTFTRLKEDVLQPHFADLVTTGEGHGWQVSVPSCQEALDATVQALMASRGSGAHVNGWC